MTHDELQVAIVRGVIAGLPMEDQAKIHTAAKAIREEMGKHGKEHGALGLALVGAETAASELSPLPRG